MELKSDLILFRRLQIADCTASRGCARTAWCTKAAAPGLLALGSDSSLAVVWDVQRGEVVNELEAHTQNVHQVLFDSGGGLLSCSRRLQQNSRACVP